MAGVPGVGLTTLVWTSGPLTDAFAALGPAVDAGSVNQWGPAQALARAGLTPGARLLKNRRLAALLAPLRPLGSVVVGGVDGLAALAWLPGTPAATAVIVDAIPPSAGPHREAVAEAGLVVVTDPDAERWARDEAGIGDDRLRRHALLDGPEPAGAPGSRIGLVGWDATGVGAVVAGRLAADPDVAVTWFVDEEAAWGLWQGPTASPLADRVHVAPDQPRAADLAGLAVVVAGAPGPPATRVTAAARAAGIPVTVLGRADPGRAVDAAGAPGPATSPWTTLTVEAGARALADELRG
jgi:hypothetical protein